MLPFLGTGKPGGNSELKVRADDNRTSHMCPRGGRGRPFWPPTDKLGTIKTSTASSWLTEANSNS
jgi:hypothetical protein